MLAIKLTIRVTIKRTKPAAIKAFSSGAVASPNLLTINEATEPPALKRIYGRMSYTRLRNV